MRKIEVIQLMLLKIVVSVSGCGTFACAVERATSFVEWNGTLRMKLIGFFRLTRSVRVPCE